MKYNEFIAALASLQKSDVNPEVTDWDGEIIIGADFIENNVVILSTSSVSSEFVPEDEEIETDDALGAPVEFKAPDFKM